MEPDRNAPKNSKPYNTYLKYGNLTVQLFAAIGLAAWGGYKLDQYLDLPFRFLLSFVLISFTGMMVMVYRSINK